MGNIEHTQRSGMWYENNTYYVDVYAQDGSIISVAVTAHSEADARRIMSQSATLVPKEK